MSNISKVRNCQDAKCAFPFLQLNRKYVSSSPFPPLLFYCLQLSVTSYSLPGLGGVTPSYNARQCNEYMKLALMGHTIIYSSGDTGVATFNLTESPTSPPSSCLNPANLTEPTDGTFGRFSPGFPMTCPWITAIGATQVIPNTPVSGPGTPAQPEMACESVIFSGGGFSDQFALPSYQENAMREFFRNHPPPYGPETFNNSQRVRAYPDFASNGANFIISVQEEFELVFGTSASAPTSASLINLINERRLRAGKRVVGFINPTVYAHPEMFNDVTAGGNQGCGTPGFTAVEGWDPVTGMGTPRWEKMLEVFMSLP
jgi:tripeptidyl-peptidase-1